jgi:hypothetical protein
MNIVTEHVYPPIPDRSCDWSAIDSDTYDGAPDSHCPIGRGPTKEAAVADLLEQIEERSTVLPWRLDGASNAHVLGGDYHVIESGEAHYHPEEGMTGFRLCGFMSMADARLIAAAPDLAEALRAVAEFWAGGDAPEELTQQINAALDKAGV